MLVSWIRIGFVALATLVPLLSLASLSKLSAFDLAIVTRHFGLPFLVGQADNGAEDSACRLTPRAGFGPALGSSRERGF